MAFKSFVSNRKSIEGLNGFIRAISIFVFKEAVSLRNIAILHQVEEFQLPKSLTDLSDLMIHKGKREPSQINLILLPCILQRVQILLQEPLLEKLVRLPNFEDSAAFNIRELGM